MEAKEKIPDDWMHPKASCSSWSAPQTDGTRYIIQRQKRTIVFGNPGSIVEWRQWAEFETREQRDAELKRLRETTTWSLRGRTVRYQHGVVVHVSNPGEFDDD